MIINLIVTILAAYVAYTSSLPRLEPRMVNIMVDQNDESFDSKSKAFSSFADTIDKVSDKVIVNIFVVDEENSGSRGKGGSSTNGGPSLNRGSFESGSEVGKSYEDSGIGSATADFSSGLSNTGDSLTNSGPNSSGGSYGGNAGSSELSNELGGISINHGTGSATGDTDITLSDANDLLTNSGSNSSGGSYESNAASSELKDAAVASSGASGSWSAIEGVSSGLNHDDVSSTNSDLSLNRGSYGDNAGSSVSRSEAGVVAIGSAAGGPSSELSDGSDSLDARDDNGKPKIEAGSFESRNEVEGSSENIASGSAVEGASSELSNGIDSPTNTGPNLIGGSYGDSESSNEVGESFNNLAYWWDIWDIY